jgi:uncharacterized protein YaaW (UPF0174 family)
LLSVLVPMILSVIGRQVAVQGPVAAMEMVGVRIAAAALRPIAAAIGVLLAAHSLAGPSLRGTIPAVAQVALLRQRLMWEAMA